MIYFPRHRVVYLHCPKTGGSYFRECVRASGIEFVEWEPRHAALDVAKERAPDARVFCFLRHPESWLRSYWVDRMTKGWGGDLTIAHACRAEDFNEFVALVTSQFPGYVGELFGRYAGSGELTCDKVYLWREFPLVITRVFEWITDGGKFSRAGVLAVPRVNMGDESLTRRAVYNPETLGRLYTTESIIIRKYWGINANQQ